MLLEKRPLKLTYEDYLHWPPDGRRHEILDGEHSVSPAPSPSHQGVLMQFVRLLAAFVHEHRLGRLFTAPIDVVLSPVDVVQPDLVFLRQERLQQIQETHVAGAPDLALEVISPSSRRTDLITKRHLYEKHGVAEYWVADPELETVEVFRLAEGGFRRTLAGDTLESPLFPGLQLSLREIFSP